MTPIGFSKEKCLKIMQKKDIDFLIASTPENVFYTSGLPVRHSENNPILYSLRNSYPSITVVRQNGEESVIAWGVFDPAYTWVQDYRTIFSRGEAIDALLSIIKEKESQKPNIGIEYKMPFYQFDELKKAFPDAIFTIADDIFTEMRMIKSEEEIERIKKSTLISEKSILAMLEELREGITDIELLEIAKTTVVKEGASGWDHVTLSLGDSDPEAPGTGVKMKKNHITRFDVGAFYKGYCSDISRHAVLGKAPPGVEKTVKQIVDVQQKCIDAIKPDVSALEINELAQKEFEALGEEFPFFPTCHGIGIDCEESHLFDPLYPSGQIFKEGMVFELEYWAPYEPYNNRLIGMEDCFVVTKSGCKRISTLDRLLLFK